MDMPASLSLIKCHSSIADAEIGRVTQMHYVREVIKNHRVRTTATLETRVIYMAIDMLLKKENMPDF